MNVLVKVALKLAQLAENQPPIAGSIGWWFIIIAQSADLSQQLSGVAVFHFQGLNRAVGKGLGDLVGVAGLCGFSQLPDVRKEQLLFLLHVSRHFAHQFGHQDIDIPKRWIGIPVSLNYIFGVVSQQGQNLFGVGVMAFYDVICQGIRWEVLKRVSFSASLLCNFSASSFSRAATSKASLVQASSSVQLP